MKRILGVSILLAAMPAAAGDMFSAELVLGDSNRKLDVSSVFVNDFFPARDWSFLTEDHSNLYGIKTSYHPFKYFSVDLEYQRYGKFAWRKNSSRITLDGDSINYGVKAILPLAGGYSLNASLGIADWDMSSRFADANPYSPIDRTNGQGKDKYYGFGGTYDVNKNLFVGLNYSIVNMSWGTSEEIFTDIFELHFQHKIKNISMSIGKRF